VRLLHTSDWHLGQTLHNFERTYEHQCFLDWLFVQIETHKVDALLVSGDVFDNANPSAASQKQFYHFLKDVKKRAPHLEIVLIAGNHDSPGRLEAPSPLLDLFDTVVVGHVSRDASGEINLERMIVPLKDREGRIAAWCLAIPFLRPGDVPRVETTGDSYTEGIALLYQRALDLALSRREPGQAIVALGHCHMVGGQVTEDSERRIVIGNAEALSSEIFPEPIAYTALGHLHRAQQVGNSALRYSGSPLPMSFAEISYPHQVVLVDLNGASIKEITAIPVPRFVKLLRVPEKPASVLDVLAELTSLTLPDCPTEEHPYLEVCVRLDAPEPGLRSQIEAVLNGKPVKLAKIETSYARTTEGETAAGPVALDDLGRLQPEDIFKKLYHQKWGEEVPNPMMGAFAELLHEPSGGSGL
jgi:DNA repair protein SbcD/Mre11